MLDRTANNSDLVELVPAFAQGLPDFIRQQVVINMEFKVVQVENRQGKLHSGRSVKPDATTIGTRPILLSDAMLIDIPHTCIVLETVRAFFGLVHKMVVGMLLGLGRRKTYKFVFVFTYGRSGSTLLMGLLNSLKNYCIRGENNNVLHHIFQASRALDTAREKSAKNSQETTNPWYGLNVTRPDEFHAELIQAFVDDVLVPPRGATSIGFKEIRFSEAEVPDFKAYMSFVQTSFPGCRIIFNHRRLEDVASSKWWSTMPNALEKLQVMEDRFNSVPATGDVFHFHYDRIFDNLSHIRELFEFLGEPFEEVHVREVLSVRHSY